MRTGANIKITVPGKTNVEVGGGTKDHAMLKHLSFDKSGHTGFQKELTPEELKHMQNIQANWNQYDETADDFVKNRTHYVARELYQTQHDAVYVFSKGANNWTLSIEFSNLNFELGYLYEIKALNAPSIIIEVSEEAYYANNCFINAYSSDGKYYLNSTGVLGEGVELNGYEPGIYGGVMGFISYVSESLEEPFGDDFDRQFEELGGWEAGDGFFCPLGVIEVYKYTPVPLEKKFLPEDVEYTGNKVLKLSKDNTDEQYPSAKAVYDAVDTVGDFELIESATLTEDVVTISPTINRQYKEIYWVFDIPPMSEIDTTDKGRLFLFPVANKTTINGAKLIQQGNIIMSNPANEWKLMIRSEVCGNYARTELWYDDNAIIISGSYGRTPDTNNQRGIVSPYTLVTNPYIDGLTLIMTSSNGGRVFPAGTKYELWGVKA